MFHISLEYTPDGNGGDECPSLNIGREYDPKLDDVRSILFDICQVFADSRKIKFNVEGFGQAHWPVDVSTDLMTVIEQLPDLLDWLDSASIDQFDLDFYEQGIERVLLFKRVNNEIRIACESRTSWQPDTGEELIQKTAFDTMFTNLANDFIGYAKKLCPNIVRHKWFQEWQRQECLLRRLPAESDDS